MLDSFFICPPPAAPPLARSVGVADPEEDREEPAEEEEEEEAEEEMEEVDEETAAPVADVPLSTPPTEGGIFACTALASELLLLELDEVRVCSVSVCRLPSAGYLLMVLRRASSSSEE